MIYENVPCGGYGNGSGGNGNYGNGADEIPVPMMSTSDDEFDLMERDPTTGHAVLEAYSANRSNGGNMSVEMTNTSLIASNEPAAGQNQHQHQQGQNDKKGVSWWLTSF
jgi:hypothetical protein